MDLKVGKSPVSKADRKERPVGDDVMGHSSVRSKTHGECYANSHTEKPALPLGYGLQCEKGLWKPTKSFSSSMGNLTFFSKLDVLSWA